MQTPTDSTTDGETTGSEPTDPLTETDSSEPSDTAEPGTEPADAGQTSTDPGDTSSEPEPDAGVSDAGATPPDASAADAGEPVTDDSSDETEPTSPDQDAAPPSDAGEQPSEDPWAACPSEDDFQGDPESNLTLEVTSGAVYCATFNETRTLKEELAAKAQLRFTPGTYSLPNALSYEAAWPACLRLGQGAGVPAAAGTNEYSINVSEGSATHPVDTEQSFGEVAPGVLRARVETTVEGGADSDAVFLLDGNPTTIDNFDVYQSFEWCPGGGGDCFPNTIFTSCTWDQGRLNQHDVTLESGEISFELRIGDSFASTEPGAFVRASGSFNGQQFDQTDYYKLIYSPAHHHFTRSFVVLFDEPIDEVCGVEVSSLDPFDAEVGQAYTVDCELNQLGTLAIEEHVFTRED